MPKKSLIDLDSDDLMTTYSCSKSSLSRRESVWGGVRRWRTFVLALDHCKKEHLEWKDKMQLKREAAESSLLGFMGSVAVSVHDKFVELEKIEKKR